jgi:hypothetical protein
MKKYIYISLLILVTSVSCEKSPYLDSRPYTQSSPENFYKTENDFKLAMIGVYDAMSAKSVGGVQVTGGTYYYGMPYIMTGPSDEVTTIQNGTAQPTDFLKASYTESTEALRRFWTAFYAGINRCNAVIHHLGNLQSESLKTSFEAEARFMRGFYYWNLAQHFGGMPIAVYGSKGQEPRASLQELYNYILGDLRYAYEKLPENGGSVGSASATKYTAAAYIGRICNFLAACKRYGTGEAILKNRPDALKPLNDYSWVDEDAMSSEAYLALKDIVDNSTYELVGDFTDLFRETTKSEQHKECLFLVENYLDGSENDFSPSSYYGFFPVSGGDEEKGQHPTVWGNYTIPTAKIFEMYSPKDPRRDWFFTGRASGSVEAGTLIEEKRGDVTYVIPYLRGTASSKTETDSDRQTFLPFVNGSDCCVGKFRLAQLGQLNHGPSAHGLSFPLMRLADVYLMYAEAIYFVDDDEDTARSYMKKVVSRACALNWSISEGKALFKVEDNQTLTDELMTAYQRADFITELLEHRERELVFEGSRKYDLIRFNMIDKEIDKLVSEGPSDGNLYSGSYKRFEDGKIVKFNSSYMKQGLAALKDNWRPYKIWLPISSLEISANQSIKQNPEW